jgi:UDP-N-acetylmuramoyl-tripeptide--D-alanyl-D-alanine ligase
MNKERNIGSVREIARLLEQVNIEAYGEDSVNAAVTDSRAVRPQALFFAIKGERTDGHLYLKDVFDKGAAAAIVEKGHPYLKELSDYDGQLIEVPDVIDAMQKVATWYRGKFDIPVVAVTGSSGKTTTKDMVRDVLLQSFAVQANPGSFNNEIGLPLTVLGLTPEHQVLVLEMGMRGLGQIKALCEIAKPGIGIITNIGVTHLELLKTEENIFAAKTELLEAIPEDGLCILNAQDRWTLRAKEKCRAKALTYGFSKEDTIHAENLVQMGTDTVFQVYYMDQHMRCQLPLLGEHNVLDALSAMLVGLSIGMDLDSCVRGIENLVLSDKRLKYEKGIKGSIIINDCYNANPDSMKASLGILEKHEGRRVAVLGDMLELGTIEHEAHRMMGELAADQGVALLVGIGPLAKDIVAGANSRKEGMAVHFEDNPTAATYLIEHIEDGDTLLFKGSRAMKLEEIIERILDEDIHG